MFSTKIGDLFEEDFDAVAHGCNCMGLMGAGIAAEFAKRYPDMAEAYGKLCARNEFVLGDFFVWDTPGLRIYNLATQFNPGADARDWAVASSLRQATLHAEVLGVTRFGIPLIGGGIGGLDPAHVTTIFKDIGVHADIELVLVIKE